MRDVPAALFPSEYSAFVSKATVETTVLRFRCAWCVEHEVRHPPILAAVHDFGPEDGLVVVGSSDGTISAEFGRPTVLVIDRPQRQGTLKAALSHGSEMRELRLQLAAQAMFPRARSRLVNIAAPGALPTLSSTFRVSVRALTDDRREIIDCPGGHPVTTSRRRLIERAAEALRSGTESPVM